MFSLRSGRSTHFTSWLAPVPVPEKRNSLSTYADELCHERVHVCGLEPTILHGSGTGTSTERLRARARRLIQGRDLDQ
jgi:hypothetical protein